MLCCVNVNHLNICDSVYSTLKTKLKYRRGGGGGGAHFLRVDPLGRHPGGVMLSILQRVHDLEVGVLPVLVHHNLVEVAGVGALQAGTLLQVLDHVLFHVQRAEGLQCARTP